MAMAGDSKAILARSVVDAGRTLGDSLGEDRATVVFLANRLEARLVGLDSGTAAVRDQAFEQLEGRGAEPLPAPAVDEVLAALVVDVQASRVAVAAGLAVGELGPPSGVEDYHAALADLDHTARESDVVEPSLAFEAAAAPATVASANLNTARTNFKARSAEALDAIVAESQTVLAVAFDGVKKLPIVCELADMIASAKGCLTNTPSVGRLIRLGLVKLRRVLQALERLLRLPGFDALGQTLSEPWQTLEAEGIVQGAVRLVVGVPSAERDVEAALEPGDLELARIDTGTGELITLSARFAGTMKLIGRLLKAFALAAATAVAVAVFVAVVSPYVVAISAAVYLLALAGVVLIARDYVDSGAGLGAVRGVCSIAREMSAQ